MKTIAYVATIVSDFSDDFATVPNEHDHIEIEMIDDLGGVQNYEGPFNGLQAWADKFGFVVRRSDIVNDA